MSQGNGVIFISSTNEDLAPFRKAARDAVLDAGFQPLMQEHFAAGAHPPLPECLDKVDKCDAVVAVVAQRYGWVPDDQDPPGGKSITWLECEHARAAGKPVYAFLVDENYRWPVERAQKFEIVRMIDQGTATCKKLEEVVECEKSLRAFKSWLGKGGVWKPFRTREDLKHQVFRSLVGFLEEKGAARSRPETMRAEETIAHGRARTEIVLRFPLESEAQTGQVIRVLQTLQNEAVACEASFLQEMLDEVKAHPIEADAARQRLRDSAESATTISRLQEGSGIVEMVSGGLALYVLSQTIGASAAKAWSQSGASERWSHILAESAGEYPRRLAHWIHRSLSSETNRHILPMNWSINFREIDTGLALLKPLGAGFNNPIEYNAEYILIPGGTIAMGESKETVTVGDMFFAKYPVTFKQYHRFERYLDGEERELQEMLPVEKFMRLLASHAERIPGFPEYLGRQEKTERGRFRSEEDGNERFDRPDHPVVGVSWFDARAYCLWVSALSRRATNQDAAEDTQHGDMEFRLPTEQEWEWAAAGRGMEGAMREYPWGNEEPSEQRANYGQGGRTSPVDSHPEGATPEGLMDMAGNAWEWVESQRTDGDYSRVVRGGSWGINPRSLRCAYRLDVPPEDRGSYVGFRVVSVPRYD
jgi:formylglycine-generating enzyme required for sulfatase activity/nucleoside 2-deoxyribosyltransferase